MAPGEEKEDALDFALWKGAKPGEPAWPSPWGEGRPGWHVECSAMNMSFLPLDIHGGGQDLVFPHHENEVAQSEAAFGCKLANYWMHNGFVRIDSEKMSKSLGNFRTIRSTLEDWLPETLRFFLLGKHYRSPIDFTEAAMLDAEKGQRRIYAALDAARNALKKGKWKGCHLPEEIVAEWQAAPASYVAALDDDLNTAQAIGHIFGQARLVNRLLEDSKLASCAEARDIFKEFLERARGWDADLGLFGQDPDEFIGSLRAVRAKRSALDVARVESLLNEREQARAERDFQKSDALRDSLAAMGVIVRDTPSGQVWDLE